MSKKSSLRSKAIKKASLNNKIAQFKQESNSDQEQYHDNPMLKLAKQTKKEKREIKSQSFNEKLSKKVVFNTSSSISKSSRRRQNRKQKEQLTPKMLDLLTNLPSTNIVPTKKTTSTFVEPTVKNSNKPNAAKISGHKKILEIENINFQNVLKNDSFRSSPFDTLRAAIKAKATNL